MAQMAPQQRDSFLAERRVAVLGIAREGSGPLLAPIWFRYEPATTAFTFCMAGSSAKARRLAAAQRATVCVQGEDFPYRYVVAEGPVTVRLLGEETYEQVRAMATRYLGEDAGRHYADQFATPDEVLVTLIPSRWQAEIPGPAAAKPGAAESVAAKPAAARAPDPTGSAGTQA